MPDVFSEIFLFLSKCAKIDWVTIKEILMNPYSPLGFCAWVVVPLLIVLLVKLGLAVDFNEAVEDGPKKVRTFRDSLYWLWPKKIILSQSFRQDLKITFLNIFLNGPIILAAIPYYDSTDIAAKAQPSLAGFFHLDAAALQPVESGVLVDFAYALTLLIGVNFGYWLAHYLMHKVPFLWELHKLHHSAEYLTGFTSHRIHILDDFLWLSAGGLTMALSAILFHVAFGFTPSGSTNLIVFYSMYFIMGPINILFHCPYWISFGRLEYLFTSPAMHTIHHSLDPKHYNCNYGSALSIFDGLFGTLKTTEKTPPANLRLGLNDKIDYNNTSAVKAVYLPIIASLSHFIFWKNRRLE